MCILLLIGLCSSTFAARVHVGRRFNDKNTLRQIDSNLLSKEQWYMQRLNHFTLTDRRVWKQRYFVNDTFFDPKHPGPVFLVIGGEGEISGYWSGAPVEYAKKFRALCFNLEHRYYGASHPTEDVSDKNLQYLSSQQALADLANFIAAMNDRYKLDNNVKWVAFGASYAGSLAAWLRLKYPHLVHAAVSSSGPLLAKLNFEEYYEVVIDTLAASGGEQCIEVLKAAHRQITQFVDKNSIELESKFRLCKSLRKATKNDIRNFYSVLAESFAGLYMDNENYNNSICNNLTMPTELREYERFLSLILDTSKKTCFDYDNDVLMKGLREPSWSAKFVQNGLRQWSYQNCNEFGFFLTSSRVTEVFGNNFTSDFYAQQCQEVFGAQFTQKFIHSGVDNTNNVYGALNISVDRVVFVHGSGDPWHTLGITKTRHEGAPAIYINGTGHCDDIYPSRPDDSEALKEARVKIVQYLDKWLNQRAEQ